MKGCYAAQVPSPLVPCRGQHLTVPASRDLVGNAIAGVNPNGHGWHGPAPKRHKNGHLVFSDFPEFTPNMTPSEVLHAGSFGGGYFRDLDSGVTGARYVGTWKELPEEWWSGLNTKHSVASSVYRVSANKYGVNCGAKDGKGDSFGLLFWESKSWINEQDPYGWFMWYCRFFQGRRSDDDVRQIKRWCGVCGPRGRFRNNLIGKCLRSEKSFDDASVSPVIRQTLQHWAYRLTAHDFVEGAKKRV